MARHTKEWNEGYQAAIEAIKKAMQGGSQDGSGSGSDGEGLPSDMTPPPSQGGESSAGGKKQGKKNQQSSDGGSRTSAKDPGQGVVRPEDCCSNSSAVSNTPSTPGGFFSKEDGDKIAQAEGYDKEGGSQDAVERDWKDAATKAAQNIKDSGKPGDVWGRLKSTIEGLYKPTKDWKKAFDYIIGKSFNEAETRSALVHKNILVTQDRMARTDKDKYDNTDYMIFVIDSSGSMTDDDLKFMLSEIYAIAEAKKPMKLYIVQCDTKVQEIKEYNNLQELKRDSLKATVKGRGGTDMGDFFKVFATDKRFKQQNPDLIIIFTDSDSRGRQYRRDRRKMNWLCWCIMDDPGFTLQFPDKMTKIIHLKSSDIKR